MGWIHLDHARCLRASKSEGEAAGFTQYAVDVDTLQSMHVELPDLHRGSKKGVAEELNKYKHVYSS